MFNIGSTIGTFVAYGIEVWVWKIKCNFFIFYIIYYLYII